MSFDARAILVGDTLTTVPAIVLCQRLPGGGIVKQGA
jgi:hypothetical protein